VAPWYGAIIVRDPGFAYHFFIDQHLVRFFTPEYHGAPFWYYVPVLLVGCLPWSLLLAPATRYLFGRSPAVRHGRPPCLGFFLLWAGWCVLFFSLSSGKLPPYILPALPAVALLIGAYLDHVLSAGADLAAARLGVLQRGAIALACVWASVSVGAWSLHLIGPLPALVLAGLGAGCAAALVVRGRLLSPRAAGLILAGLGLALSFELTQGLVPAFAHRHATLTESQAIAQLLQDRNLGVACYGGEWGSVLFYVGRDDDVLNFSEQPVGEFSAFLRQHPRNLVILRRQEDLDTYRLYIPAGMTIVPLRQAGSARVVLVQEGNP
jgi:dolichol-phosphate mannosyltransferase